MYGYVLVQKHKGKPIKIAVENDQGEFVDVLVFSTKKGLLTSTDIEDDEEIRKINITS